MQAVWGKADWDLKTPDGKSFWAEHNMNEVVRAIPPAAELPYLAVSSSNGYADCRKLYSILLDRHAGVMAEFSWGGARYVPVSNSGTFPNVIRLDIRTDRPYLAFSSAQAIRLVTQGEMGEFNHQFRWRDAAEQADRFEATIFLQGRGDSVADVTPRRCRQFRPAKGTACAWKTVSLDGKTELQGGEATVGDSGLLVLKAVQLAEQPRRLIVRLK
jgi:hypothetical protein